MATQGDTMKLRVAAWIAVAAGASMVGAVTTAGQQATRVDYSNRQASQVKYLKASNPGEDDKIGIGDPLVGVTLAMSDDGRTIAVSTPHEDSVATGVNGKQDDESAWDSGAAYIFVRTGDDWMQQAYLKASNTQTSDKFGFAIALSGDGNTAAVSATLEDSNARGINGNQQDNSAESSGAVYVFVRTGATWTQQAYLKASNADAGDQFGWSVALNHDGSTLAVGAQGEASGAPGINGNQADNDAADAGATYVFVRRGATWTQQAYIKASNAQGGDRFGFCAALSGDGNTLAVCGYDEDGSATGINGPQNNDAGGSGAAYVFVRRGTAWSQEAYVKPSNTLPNEAFGSALALSADGNTLAVNAADEDSLSRGIDGDQSSVPVNEGSAGAVYVYGRANGVWMQQAYVKSFNIGPIDLFGIRLALSRDGSVLAAGAPGQSGAGHGINPYPHDLSVHESGAVYVFTRTEGKWSQNAYLKAPNSEEYDQFGGGVALSGDGATLAASSNGEDGGSKGAAGDQHDNSLRDSGAVFVF
jgi:hypothetical protein